MSCWSGDGAMTTSRPASFVTSGSFLPWIASADGSSGMSTHWPALLMPIGTTS